MITVHITNYETWKLTAKKLLAANVFPDDVQWLPLVKQDPVGDQLPQVPWDFVCYFPKAFRDLAQMVVNHEDTCKWELLYRVLWRLNHDEPYLVSLSIDKDMHELRRMEKDLRRGHLEIKSVKAEITLISDLIAEADKEIQRMIELSLVKLG
jgi:uracil-DNA glycosylase